MNKGILALDIDGTLTADLHEIPTEVSRYLEHLDDEGWKVCLITGRGFALAGPALQSFSFPYKLAVHNGALILEMPDTAIIGKCYLDRGAFPVLEEICANEPTDFIIYTGIEDNDRCYYRPHRFEKKLLEYVENRIRICRETWNSVEDYDNLSITGITALKCFGTEESLRQITRKALEKYRLHFPIIRDPLGEDIYIAQATHEAVSKGRAVEQMRRLTGCSGPVIAAGDDNNDLPLLEAADYRIAMAGAPEALRKIADAVAPPARELGIIQALEKAIELVNRGGAVK